MKNKQFVYATTNPAKIAMMRGFLEPLKIEIVGLEKALPEVAEGEKLPLLNARKKAEAYFEALKRPVFSCDSGLFFDELPEEFQPGVNVRTINGQRLSDEEMIAYYSSLAKKFGKLTAQYRNAICFILGDNERYEYDGEDLCGEKFIISDRPHEMRAHGFPIDSLSIDIATQKYYYDLPVGRRGFSMEKGFQKFFAGVITQSDRAAIGMTVTVTMDRPVGAEHPKRKGLIYPINYGYIEGLLAGDGEEQDVYILGIDKPLKTFTGKIIAVVKRFDDIENKWVAAPEDKTFTKAEIEQAVAFQEKYYKTEVIT